MRAIRVYEFGGPGVLHYRDDVPAPEPGPREVLVRVHAAGVNHAERLQRLGQYGTMTLPFTPGLELAGVVERVGAEVTEWRPGERVFGRAISGGYAELATARADWLLPIPENVTVEEAAALPVVLTTAWHALVTLGELSAGQSVLVHAAGSGVGTTAIQIARAFGGEVIATAATPAKRGHALALGARAALDYTASGWHEEVLRLTEGRGVDLALDGLGAATFNGTLECTARDGRVFLYGLPTGATVNVDLRALMGRYLSVMGISVSRSARVGATWRDLRERGLDLLARGQIRPTIHRVLPLEQAAEAHLLIDRRAVIGKLVLRVAG